MAKLTPEELIGNEDFELLAEVEHKNVKHFILEQITMDIPLIKTYSIYQVAMLAFFIFLLTKSIVLALRGMNEALIQIGYAVIFSFSVLVILHEFLHAVAYWVTGNKNLKVGAIWKKFIFYVVADRQVIDYNTFLLVAWAPFVVVKVVCLVLGILFWSTSYAYFFFGVMAIHSLFCAGDMAMLAFYRIHEEKEILNFDDVRSGKTYFYFRKLS